MTRKRTPNGLLCRAIKKVLHRDGVRVPTRTPPTTSVSASVASSPCTITGPSSSVSESVASSPHTNTGRHEVGSSVASLPIPCFRTDRTNPEPRTNPQDTINTGSASIACVDECVVHGVHDVEAKREDARATSVNWERASESSANTDDTSISDITAVDSQNALEQDGYQD